MLVLSGISKVYEGRQVLRSIDLEVPPGRTTVLIGPSGCGKSTLLRLMIGLVRPDGGTVTFEGTPVTSETVPTLRTQMGYVIQEGGLFPHLTARENIVLMARFLGWRPERLEPRLSQ